MFSSCYQYAVYVSQPIARKENTILHIFYNRNLDLMCSQEVYVRK